MFRESNIRRFRTCIVKHTVKYVTLSLYLIIMTFGEHAPHYSRSLFIPNKCLTYSFAQSDLTFEFLFQKDC